MCDCYFYYSHFCFCYYNYYRRTLGKEGNKIEAPAELFLVFEYFRFWSVLLHWKFFFHFLIIRNPPGLSVSLFLSILISGDSIFCLSFIISFLHLITVFFDLNLLYFSQIICKWNFWRKTLLLSLEVYLFLNFSPSTQF